MSAVASMSGWFAVARAAFLEVIRQPAHGVVLVATLAVHALSPFLALFALRGEAPLLRDFGVSTVLLSGALITALGASGVVRREIEDRTALVLLSRPLSRGAFLLGKYLGVLGAVTVVTAVSASALLLAVRQGPVVATGFRFDVPAVLGGAAAFGGALVGAGVLAARSGRPFASSFTLLAAAGAAGALLLAACLGPDGTPQAFGTGLEPMLLRAALLAWLALAVLAAFAVAVSVWVGWGGTFSATLALFAGGLALGPSAPSGGPGWLPVPDFRVFWTGDLFYLAEPSLGGAYILHAGLYAGAHVVAFLALGILAFLRKGL